MAAPSVTVRSTPSGFKMPEGESETFDQVCTFKPEGAELCMTKFGDHDMGYAEKGEKEKEPTYDKFGEDVVSALKNQEGPQSPGGPY